MADGADPERIEMVAAHTPDKLRDMVRTAYSHLRSRGQRRPKLEPTVAPLPAGERERLEEAARVALAELGSRRGAGGGRGRDRHARGRPRPARKLGDGELPDAAELKGLELKGRAKALSTPGMRGLPRGLRRVPLVRARAPGAARPHDAERPARALRRALRPRRSASAPGSTSRTSSWSRATCSRATQACARPTPGRFEHVLVDEFQDTNPAAERAARAARARQPVPRRGREPVDLPLPQRRRGRVPRSLGRRRRGGPRREHHGQLPRARRDPRRDRPRLRAHLGRALRAAARGARRPRAGRRASTPASSCSWSIRPKKRWDEAAGLGDEPFGAGLASAPPWRAA